MKRVFLIFLSILSFVWVRASESTFCMISPSSEEETDSCVHCFDVAQKTLEWVIEGKGDSLLNRFQPAIRSTVPVSAVNEIWKNLQERAGKFYESQAWSVENRDSLLVEQCILVFEKEYVRFALLTNKNDEIVGFHFNPLTGSVLPQKDVAKEEVEYVERDTFVVHGRVRLPATISVPVKRKGKCPAVVIVHDLGPTDRDGTLGPNKPYREVAHQLAANGIVTLRYDKRTFVYGSSSREFGNMMTYDSEVVDDALEALRMLAKMPEVDCRRIFVAGHSLGGMLAPRIVMLSSVPVAGIVAVASTTRHLEEWLRAQFRHLARIEGTSEQQADSLTQIIYSKMPAAYRNFASQYNPVGTARGLHVPMLIMQGGHDFQVTEEDFQMWKQGLEGCEDIQYLWLDKGDHLLREIPDMAVPEIYMHPGRVSQIAVDAIVRFVRGE